MPRPPKKCGKTSKPSKNKGKSCEVVDVEQSGSVAALIKELLAACEEWTSKHHPHSLLPMEAVQQLSSMAYEVKMDSWRSKESGVDSQAAKDFTALAETGGDVLARVFKSLQGKCLTPGDLEKCRPESSQAKLQNDAAGLTLASIVFDLSATIPPCRETVETYSPPNFQPSEEVIAQAVAFLWHEVRFALPMLLEAKAATAEAATACAKMTRALRSIHHLFASRRYSGRALPATCLAHRSPVLAAQCSSMAAGLASSTPVVIKTPLTALGGAAGDLLAALLGYGCTDPALQSTAFTELCRLATSPAMLVNSPNQAAKTAALGPSFLAMALRAIGATLLPLSLSRDSRGAAQVALMARAGAACVASAEERAGGLAAALLQHVLVDPQGDVKQLEAFMQQLVALCGDPAWAGAPLLALRMVGSLRRVVGASRGMELECSRREEATRLIGKAAEALCAQHMEAFRDAPGRCSSCQSQMFGNVCDVCMLSREAASTSRKGAATSPMLVLASFLRDSAEESILLAPAGSGAASGDLRGSAVPASSASCNAAAVLCLASGTPAAAKAAKGGKKAKSGSKAGQVSESKLELLLSWRRYDTLPQKPGGKSDTAAKQSASVQANRSARKLYAQLLWRDEASYLCRARTATLEALLSIAKHPLALVRRQAVVGLALACAAEPELIASRCVVESIAGGLRDESALARLASVDLVVRLSSGDHGAVIGQRLNELRGAVTGRLADPSPLVRRAAFKAACQWLEEGGDRAQRLRDAGGLLRKLRSEIPTTRAYVLAVLARVVFHALVDEDDQPGTRLENLRILLVQSGAGGNALRDVIAAQCQAMDAWKEAEGAAAETTSAMAEIVACALALLPDRAEEVQQDHLQYLTLLEQIGLVRSHAFQSSLAHLQKWLDVAQGQEPLKVDANSVTGLELPICACNILAQVLPPWAEQASTLSKQSLARKLLAQLAVLMDAAPGDLGLLARAVVRCLTVLVPLWPPASQLLIGHFGRSTRVLAEVVQQCGPVPYGKFCRHAWVMGSIVEFLDRASEQQLAKEGGGHLAFESAVLLLSDCLLRGPPAAQPAVVPALGFALRRCPGLLREGEDRGPGPLQVLRRGLGATEGSAASSLRAKTAETFAGLAAFFSEVAQANSPSRHDLDAGSEASVAAQSLALLQPELLQLLQSPTEEVSTLQQALRGLHSLCDLGVIRPVSTLPSFISACLAGNQGAAPYTRSLLLRMVEKAPPLLAQKCGLALRSAAETLASSQGLRAEASFHLDAWRFAPLCEAYTEFLSDGKQLRQQFLTTFMTELISVSEDASSEGSQVVARLQLGLGWLTRLPLSREMELALIFESAIQFLTLKVMPFVADAVDEPSDDKQPSQGSSPPLALVGVAIVLHRLCMHWLSLVGCEFARQIQVFATCPGAGAGSRPSACLELPLPPGFCRKELPDFSETFQQLRTCSSPASLLTQISADSPLLAGQSAASAACARGRKRSGEEAPREQATSADAEKESGRKGRGRPKRTREVESEKAEDNADAACPKRRRGRQARQAVKQ